MTFILITPIKDEAKNILKLKETILNQTVKPLIWVIGDANSKDGSFEIAKELFRDYEWIHVISQKTFFESGYSHRNIACNLNDCYKYAKEALKNSNNFSFIARTDVTPVLSCDYFDVLIGEMERDPKIAFACGLQYLHFKNSKIRFSQLAGISNTGFNDQGVYRREFLEEMGGFPVTYSPETVLQIKALNRGWHLKLTDRTCFIKSRLGGSKIGVWNGYKLKGKVYYNLGYPISLVLIKTLYSCFKLTPKNIAILSGYFLSAIKREEKIEDEEVIEYFGKRRLKEVYSDLIKFLYFFKREKKVQDVD